LNPRPVESQQLLPQVKLIHPVHPYSVVRLPLVVYPLTVVRLYLGVLLPMVAYPLVVYPLTVACLPQRQIEVRFWWRTYQIRHLVRFYWQMILVGRMMILLFPVLLLL
jgi:hypothetical protein